MKKVIIMIVCVLASLTTVAQEFPYGKMLKMSDKEFADAKFKYDTDRNQWILRKLNGLQIAVNIFGSPGDQRRHKDDYIVTIQKGESGIASVDVTFYDDEIFHTIKTFAMDKASDVLETSSGKLNKLQFNYDGYSFLLEYTKIERGVVTARTEYSARTIDDSYNQYDFVIFTGIEAVSPYITKQIEKEAKREAKGKKVRSAASLM